MALIDDLLARAKDLALIHVEDGDELGEHARDLIHDIEALERTFRQLETNREALLDSRARAILSKVHP